MSEMPTGLASDEDLQAMEAKFGGGAAATPADAAPAAAPAPAAPGPAATGADAPINPLLLGTSAVATGTASSGPLLSAEAQKQATETADGMDSSGKLLDMLGKAAKAANMGGGEASEQLGGKIAGAASLPGDAIALGNGMNELSKGDVKNGVFDTATAAASTVGDASSAVGGGPIANVANTIKGGLEIGKGGAEVIQAIAGGGPIAPGQTGIDRSDLAMDGVQNLLKGGVDAVGAIGSQTKNPWMMGGAAAFQGGMIAGNAVAPLIFGAKDEDTHAATPDGQEHGTTGNRAIDWIAGIGQYSDGNRW